MEKHTLNAFDHLNRFDKRIYQILRTTEYPTVVGDVFAAMLHLIALKNWEGACHKTASILYVIYRELGYDTKLFMGEVQIDHRYFDHSWITVNDCILDAALLNPANKTLGLAPVFLNINLSTMAPHTLHYGAVSSLGLSEFTEIIYHRPFHKYMKPTPWGKGKWRYIETISNKLDLNIDTAALPHKYVDTERILIRDRK